MKRAVLVFMAFLLLTTTCWAQRKPVGGSPPGEGQNVTITGKMTCTFCSLPAPGKCSIECCQDCIKAGDPVLLTDAKGDLYILLTSEHEKPLMTPDRMKLLVGNVKVEGMLVKRGGIQGIYVKKMEKAP